MSVINVRNPSAEKVTLLIIREVTLGKNAMIVINVENPSIERVTSLSITEVTLGKTL